MAISVWCARILVLVKILKLLTNIEAILFSSLGPPFLLPFQAPNKTALIGQVASEKKMFENGGRQTAYTYNVPLAQLQSSLSKNSIDFSVFS